jgi:hypothetical protein
MPTTIGDVVTSALTEIRVARAGDVLPPATMARGLYVLNRLLDAWNATSRKVYATIPNDFTITPSLSPHTLGVGGTFVTTQRPEDLSAASVNIGGSPANYIPITVRNASWYARLPVPGLTATFPTDLFFSPTWPLAKLYFFPVPTTAYGVRLWWRTILARVTQDLTFDMPPGYQAAIELTLAEQLGPSFGQAVSADTKAAAKLARSEVFGGDDDAPLISTDVPGTAGSSDGFRIETGPYA